MKPKKKVFVAKSAFLAFIDRANPKHAQAVAYFNYLAGEKYQLYTGYNTILEAYKTVSEDISPSLARDFLRAITLGAINVIFPTEADLKAAIKALTSSNSRDLTLNDAQMEVLAYRNNIQEIFTFNYLPSLFGLTAFILPM
jgi:predicted nucleic acid-binding protein